MSFDISTACLFARYLRITASCNMSSDMENDDMDCQHYSVSSTDIYSEHKPCCDCGCRCYYGTSDGDSWSLSRRCEECDERHVSQLRADQESDYQAWLLRQAAKGKLVA